MTAKSRNSTIRLFIGPVWRIMTLASGTAVPGLDVSLDFSRDFDSLQLNQHGGPGKASSNKGRRLSTIGRNAAYLWAVFSKGNNTEPRS
ncbi:unnamed protein product [Fusarium graminearum]|uniref:Uncharacterized protein n=1 Tax=Gibberella zeae TaxID=5518 RepID=A0A9N8RPZ2_GIBZA|nr:unnamed protein product [Fusarium graminearum]